MNIPKLPDPEELIPTRQSLLTRLRSHDDQESWSDFFDTYWKLIYGMAIRSGLTASEAEEVVQETVICVARTIPDFKYDRSKGSFKGWLLKTTRWRIQDQLRKRQREQSLMVSVDGDTDEGIAAIAGPDEFEGAWEEEWQKNLLEAAIQKVKDQVKPKQFQIFDLYVLKKWPISKVTSTLKVNLGQVYLAKHRVMGLIKKEIKTLENKF